METPECQKKGCPQFMELKQVIKFHPDDGQNGTKFYFQCKGCGNIIKICASI